MDDNAVPVLQLDETVDGQQIHQVAKKSTIYKVYWYFCGGLDQIEVSSANVMNPLAGIYLID